MIKIAVLGITGILLALFLKETRPVFAVLISMASCMLIFFCAVEKLRYLSESLQQLQSYRNGEPYSCKTKYTRKHSQK